MFSIRTSHIKSLTALLALILVMATPFAYPQAQTPQVETPQSGTPPTNAQQAAETAGAPVIFAGETLFSVYARIGPFSPSERASDKLVGNILTPLSAVWQAFVSYLDNLFFTAVIVVVTRYLIKFIRLIFQDKFNEADIEILSPHYSALRDGNQITIPADYLPETYTPPAFRILPLEGLFGKPAGKVPSKGEYT